MLRADDGIYSVVEQKIYGVPKSKDRGVGVFMRTSASPSDRNLIDFYADAGVDFIGLSDRRQNDKFGVALGYAHVSKRAQALDRDYAFFAGLPDWPVRSSEALFIREPRHARVHHHDTGDEPADEEHAACDAEPAVGVDEQLPPVQEPHRRQPLKPGAMARAHLTRTVNITRRGSPG